MKFDAALAKSKNIRVIRSSMLSAKPETLFQRMTHTTYVTMNGKGYHDFEAAVQHADDPLYVPLVNEPKSKLVLVAMNRLGITIVKNNGSFDFTNYRFVEIIDDIEKWEKV